MWRRGGGEDAPWEEELVTLLQLDLQPQDPGKDAVVAVACQQEGPHGAGRAGVWEQGTMASLSSSCATPTQHSRPDQPIQLQKYVVVLLSYLDPLDYSDRRQYSLHMESGLLLILRRNAPFCQSIESESFLLLVVAVEKR